MVSGNFPGALEPHMSERLRSAIKAYYDKDRKEEKKTKFLNITKAFPF